MTLDRQPTDTPAAYRHVFRDSPDAYVLLTPDPPEFAIRDASRAFLEMTGVERQAIVGKSIFGVFPQTPDDRSVQRTEEFVRLYQNAVDTRQPTSLGTIRYDIDSPSGDGTVERYWSVRVLPIFDEDGRLIHLMQRAEDVTDLILRAQYGSRDRPSLQERHHHLLVVEPDPKERQFLEGILRPHWQLDSVADGHTALATIQQSSFDAVVATAELPDMRGREFVERLRRHEPELPIILRLEELDPDLYRQAFEAGADDVIGGRTNARDYVARTQAQLAAADLRRVLQERSTKQFKRLFEQAPVAIAVFEGPEHVYTLSNPAHQELINHRDVVGQSVWEAFPEPNLREIAEPLDAVYETGEPYLSREQRIEYETAEGDLGEVYLTFAYLPFRNLNGEIAGVAAFGHDVTEMVEARKRVEQLAAQARRESEHKDEFLAMLGHELRNPLAPIVHAVELMKRTDEAETLEWAKATIDRQATQLKRLVDDLLDISRINQGRIGIEPTHCQLEELVSVAVDGVQPQIAHKDQHLAVNLPAEPVTLEVDRERMIQVLTNLLDNATTYTPERGHVWLEASVDGEDLELTIRDDGEGIDPEALDEIFGLFVQVKQDLARSGGGLGLGLALVRRIVEMHDGTVEAFSDGKNMGSRFVLVLPVVVDDPTRSSS